MRVIEAKEITKTYPAQGGKRALLGRGGIARLFKASPIPRQALAPLSFSVESGEALGIIGRNGSGKSTLLKIIAGVTVATTGSLEVRGRVASLLELGAGFHPMLTGRENIYLNAGLLGMRHAQVDACFEAIVDFAELAACIDHTVDTYSSGMYVRLAFSVAIHTDPDVFLVDEVLSVGDESFQRKCRARILELKAAGKSILFVSHDLGTVQALCDRVLLLEQGMVISRGNTQDTIDYYLRQVGQTSGIHRLRHGDTELLFNHGRLSLFHRQQELTAPLGIKVQFFSMGSYHESTDADWEITQSDEEHLEATGIFPRLPLRVYFSCKLGTTGLSLEVAWENAQPLDLSYVALQCFARTSYEDWYCGTKSGTFPTITPDDHRWSAIAQPRQNVWTCALSAGKASTLPPLCFSVDEAHSQARFQIDNTDYMAQARLVHLTEAIPTGENPLPPQRRRLGSLCINPNQTMAEFTEKQACHQAAHSLEVGSLLAQLHDGFSALESMGCPITEALHLHFQLRIGELWLMSHDMAWSETLNSEGILSITGRSQRLPGVITWTLEADSQDTLRTHISLEARETFDISEYNVSVCLRPEYTRWKILNESGNFGAAGTTETDWTHLNRTYTEGTTIKALSDTFSGISLTAGHTLGTCFPTAIRTGADQDSRVLQLLCSPGQQRTFTLDAGKHDLFRGSLGLSPHPE